MNQEVKFPCVECLDVLIEGGWDGAWGSKVGIALVKLWAPRIGRGIVVDVRCVRVRWEVFERNFDTCGLIVASLSFINVV